MFHTLRHVICVILLNVNSLIHIFLETTLSMLPVVDPTVAP